MNGGGDGAWMIGICVNGRGSARFCAAEPRRADMGRYMGDAKQLATGALLVEMVELFRSYAIQL